MADKLLVWALVIAVFLAVFGGINIFATDPQTAQRGWVYVGIGVLLMVGALGVYVGQVIVLLWNISWGS